MIKKGDRVRARNRQPRKLAKSSNSGNNAGYWDADVSEFGVVNDVVVLGRHKWFMVFPEGEGNFGEFALSEDQIEEVKN